MASHAARSLHSKPHAPAPPARPSPARPSSAASDAHGLFRAHPAGSLRLAPPLSPGGTVRLRAAWVLPGDGRLCRVRSRIINFISLSIDCTPQENYLDSARGAVSHPAAAGRPLGVRLGAPDPAARMSSPSVRSAPLGPISGDECRISLLNPGRKPRQVGYGRHWGGKSLQPFV